MHKQPKGLRTWLEIDTRAIRHNYRLFRKLIGKNCKLLAVVKSNAYGHGLLDFSRTVNRLGADWFGVDSIVEAHSLRRAGIRKPILVLGHTLPERLSETQQLDIRPTVSNFAALEGLKIAGRTPIKIHLKIDTGMHRQGFLIDEMPRVVQYLKEKLPRVLVEGAYSHFAAAGDSNFKRETKNQILEFERALKILNDAGFHPLRHMALTAAAIALPHTHFDMVRIGIGLHGLWPTSQIKKGFSSRLSLQPTLTWKSVVGEIKKLPTGSKIGYGFTETLARPSTIAIVPIGYWHGYSGLLSGKSAVLIHGKRAKILGRVSMDMLTVDVSKIPAVRAGDTVTLIGQDGSENVSAVELAHLIGISHHEIVTRINPLIHRVYR